MSNGVGEFATQSLVGLDPRLRTLTAQEFAWIRRFLLERTGIELRDGKQAMVSARLDKRLRTLGLSTYTEYFALISGNQADPVETRTAVDLLTTNETYFFREPRHFEFLADLMRELPSRATPVRIWSAASSTGEEAYSIAMTLAQTRADRDWEVVGTDISGRVLETARAALYPLEAADSIPAPMLKTHCLRGTQEYAGYLTLTKPLRDRVRFTHANLLELPATLGQFDVIFLRNVMIYFGQETKRQVVDSILSHVRPGGFLLVSHSETLNGIATGLRLVKPSVYQVPVAGA